MYMYLYMYIHVHVGSDPVCIHACTCTCICIPAVVIVIVVLVQQAARTTSPTPPRAPSSVLASGSSPVYLSMELPSSDIPPLLAVWPGVGRRVRGGGGREGERMEERE